MKIFVGMLTAVVLLAIFSGCRTQPVQRPENAVRAYFKASCSNDPEALIMLLHPDYMNKIRSIALAYIETGMSEESIHAAFGVRSVPELSNMEVREFYRRMSQTKSWSKLFGAMKDLEITLGQMTIEESKDLAQIDVPVSCTINGKQRRVISCFELTKTNGVWLISDMTKVNQ